MVSKKHGRIIGYKDIFVEQHEGLPPLKIQVAEYEGKTKAINVFRYLTQNNKKQGVIVIPLSYGAIKAIIEGLAKLNGKEEVERELNIKIK